MRAQKKEYLNKYLLQEAKISRLKNMERLNPEMAESYRKELEAAADLRREIETKIAAVDGGLLSELLFQKYVFGKTLEEVSYTLNYSLRHTERLHIMALDKFEM